VANVVFVVAVVLHDSDHYRQARGIGALTPQVRASGTVVALVVVAGLVLTLVRHPQAPRLATLVGFGAAVAVIMAHLAPHWSAFSDPYWTLHLDAYSWSVMLAEIVAGFVLGIVGLQAIHVTEVRR
jgi:hypothetical protein